MMSAYSGSSFADDASDNFWNPPRPNTTNRSLSSGFERMPKGVTNGQHDEATLHAGTQTRYKTSNAPLGTLDTTYEQTEDRIKFFSHQLTQQLQLFHRTRENTQNLFSAVVATLRSVSEQFHTYLPHDDTHSQVRLDIDPDESVATLSFLWHEITFLIAPQTKPMLTLRQDGHPFFCGRIQALKGNYADIMEETGGSLDSQDLAAYELSSLFAPANAMGQAMIRMTLGDEPEECLMGFESAAENFVMKMIELLSFGGYVHD
jgi:hypothetical protein